MSRQGMARLGRSPVVEMVDTLINGRWNLKLPAHRAARPEWVTGWEVQRLAHMHDNIKPGERVLYVGGEEGDLAALLALWGAEVFIVEPNELVWPNIKAIWEANNLPTPLINYVGFCGRVNSDNWLKGFHNGPWPECADGEVIGDHGFKELRDPGERPVVTVDELVATSFRPDVISLDVEGSEWEVLQGAEDILRRLHPRIYLSLHPEFLIDQYGKYSAEVRRWIIDLGYREQLLEWPLHEAHFFYSPA